MTVVIRVRGTEKETEIKDVVNFKMDTAHFWLKLKGDKYRTYWRRNVELRRIKDEETKMTKEELIKNQFPNDEFLQSSILQIVSKCTAELEESNKEWQRACEVKSDTNSQLTEQLADKVEKLNEAKEIITALLNVFVGDIPEEDLDVGQIDCREKAERFLKEE